MSQRAPSPLSAPAVQMPIGNIKPRGNLLIVDDDIDLLKLLAIRLKAYGYQTTAVESAEKALSALSAARPDVVLTDLQMPGMDGMGLFEEIQISHPGLPVIILTAHGTIPQAVRAIKDGAFGFLTKPYDHEELQQLIEKAIALQGSAANNAGSERWRSEIITRSAVMEDLLSRSRRAAQTDATVLVTGDSGTGKEVLARAIHKASQRSTGPFVAINCGAIPEQLLESELFGHVRGSFTGAIADHRGLFQQADGGTIFLDEIGDMPLALQVKLLRVLEQREVRPVGATHSIPINVRVLAATHRDLTAAKDSGQFREDLFYRLNVVALRLPTLDERREDIPLLANHFIKFLSERYDSEAKAFTAEALEKLATANWPGNVRQLFNVVEQSVALCSTELVPAGFVEQAIATETAELASFEDARKRFEREYLTRVLKITRGSVTQAARLAKRNRTEFYKLLQRHDIDVQLFKQQQRAQGF
jgi:two-component system, NtrC family, response regulator GlrR